jgi:hypothetical protein
MTKSSATGKDKLYWLEALFDREVVDFIKIGKLVRSEKLQGTADDLIEHWMAHGDYTPLIRLIECFSDTRYYASLLRWACDGLDAAFRFEGKKLIIERRSKSSDAGRFSSIQSFLEINESRGKKADLIRRPRIGWKAKIDTDIDDIVKTDKPRKIWIRGKKGKDALNRRLPGSFESGKRR